MKQNYRRHCYPCWLGGALKKKKRLKYFEIFHYLFIFAKPSHYLNRKRGGRGRDTSNGHCRRKFANLWNLFWTFLKCLWGGAWTFLKILWNGFGTFLNDFGTGFEHFSNARHYLWSIGRVDTFDGELPHGQGLLQIGKRLLEEGHQARL